MMSLYKEKFLRAHVAMMWEKSMIFDKGYIGYEEVCKQKIKSALEGGSERLFEVAREGGEGYNLMVC